MVTIPMIELDPQTKTYLYYGLMVFSVLFLVFIFAVRYLTRYQDHHHDEEEE